MIVRWTFQELRRARARVTGSVVAVAAAFALVIMFRAVWEGETRQIGVYLERAGADVWVMQDAVSNMHMASSFIREGKRVEIARVSGVASVSGILYLNTMVEAGGRGWFSYVVGLDEGAEAGGPWAMAAGDPEPSAGEAVIPETLARLTGVGLGDSIRISEGRFEVVGLSRETFSVTNPVTFVSASDLADLLSLRGYDSYLLVQVESAAQADDLAVRIEEEVDGVAALTTSELLANDVQLSSQMGTELIALMTGICGMLATALVAFALFIHTSRTRRDLVVLKALGFTNRHLYLSVLIQATVITGLAFVSATAVVAVAAMVGPRLAPILSLSLSVRALGEIGVTGLGVAAGATILLARRVGSVDPMSAFSEQ